MSRLPLSTASWRSDGRWMDLHHVDLFLSEPQRCESRYRRVVTADDKHNQDTGTQLWWAERHNGEKRAIKEFTGFSPQQWSRKLPDPAWQLGKLHASGHERGLSPQRAAIFDRIYRDHSLKQDMLRGQHISHHPEFASFFRPPTFELEALITQFAAYLGMDLLVRADDWGSLYLPGRADASAMMGMERLEELIFPQPRECLAILDQLLAMMAAVTQLHSLLIPIRCYPPEMTPHLESSRKTPYVRPFHYDLSPHQFLMREEDGLRKLILIDFNASRADQAEFSSLSWQSIPGKDYYQAPERRSQPSPSQTLSLSFRSHPVYDLYSLLVIGLFLLARDPKREEKNIRQVEDWHDITRFYRMLNDGSLPHKLLSWYASPRSYREMITRLQPLMSAALHARPEDRIQQLQRLPHLGWRGEEDWMLIPRCMDWIARIVLERRFSIQWRSPHLHITTEDAARPIADLIDPAGCLWQPSRLEEGRVLSSLWLPDDGYNGLFSPQAHQRLSFLQAENQAPLLQYNHLIPQIPGEYTLFASFGGCVDFQRPLHVTVTPASSPPRSYTSSPSAHASSLPATSSQESHPDDGSGFYAPSHPPSLHEHTFSTPPPYAHESPSLPLPITDEHTLSQPSAQATDEHTLSTDPQAPSAPSAHHPAPSAHHPAPSAHHPAPIAHHPAPSAHHPAPIAHHPAPTNLHDTLLEDQQALQHYLASSAPYAAVSASPVLPPPAMASLSPAQTHWSNQPDAIVEHLREPAWVASISSSSSSSSPHAPEATEAWTPPPFHAAATAPPAASLMAPAFFAPTDEESGDDPLARWLLALQECDDPKQLQRDEKKIRSLRDPQNRALLMLNLQTRRCQIAWSQKKLPSKSPILHDLARLGEQLPPSSTLKGLWLLNLLSLCSLAALHEQRWPFWKGLFGFDPLERLIRWREEEASPHASPRYQEMMNAANERIDFATRTAACFAPKKR